MFQTNSKSFTYLNDMGTRQIDEHVYPHYEFTLHTLCKDCVETNERDINFYLACRVLNDTSNSSYSMQNGDCEW